MHTADFWQVRMKTRVPGPPKGSGLEGKWDPGYFREMEVGELLCHLAR